jgi:nucleotide-binding universal stress UspA family protein
MTVVALIRRLRDEFTSMPGLRLTAEQAQRLCHESESTCTSALRALVSAGFLCVLEDGSYRRTDIATGLEPHSTSTAGKPPWHRILCLVEFEGDDLNFMTAASHAALRHATALGVKHRARVTALRLVSSLPDTIAAQGRFLKRITEEVRKHVFGQTIPGLIDVQLGVGSSYEDLLRSARDIRADLIVLGRRDGGAACLSQLREMLRDAPCHVLVVHPAGHAAVA